MREHHSRSDIINQTDHNNYGIYEPKWKITSKKHNNSFGETGVLSTDQIQNILQSKTNVILEPPTWDRSTQTQFQTQTQTKKCVCKNQNLPYRTNQTTAIVAMSYIHQYQHATHNNSGSLQRISG